MKRVCVVILFAIFVSCEKEPIKEGVVTNIQGIISDGRNQLPFENLKLKVGEYKSRRAGIYMTYEFIKWIDSTYTNSEGYYNLDFVTSGKGDNYRLHVVENIDTWTYYFDPIDIYMIGKDNNRNLDFLHLYPINLVIELNNLEAVPIEIDVDLFSDLEDINSNTGTIERTLYCDKNTDSKIIFRRKTANGIYQNFTVVVPASNSSSLTTYNLTLNNTDFN